MPEGHTLHRLADQFRDGFIGQPWRVSSPQGRFSAAAEILTDRTPERAHAWGKHLFVQLGTDIWHIHLGLYGAVSFRGDEQFSAPTSIGAPRAELAQLNPQYDQDGWIIPEPPVGAVRARVHAQHGWADLRGPATCALVTEAEYGAITARLGPDPLHQPPDEFDEVACQKFVQNLGRRRISIAAALMEQAVVAGVGNIYRAEALFVERLDPSIPANQVSRSAAESLWHTLSEQLRQGYAEGTIRTLRESVLVSETILEHRSRPDASSGTGQQLRRHWVYKHQGTGCLRCGSHIRRASLQGRLLYWCPGCQDRGR